MAQQQQIQHLSDRYAQMTVDHQLMLQEVIRVQKTVLNHENVIHQVMAYLLSVDARQRRDSKSAAPFPPKGQASSTMSPSQVASMEDEPSSPLQQASKLLNDVHSEMQFNLAGEPPQATPVVSTPTMDPAARNGMVRPPTSTNANANPAAMVYPAPTPRMNGEMDNVVYPVGATNGIDPMYHDHVNNVPYAMPPKSELEPGDARRQLPDNRKKTNNVDPGWMRSPQILLVEDDATCRQIGGKFLYSFSCVIDTAVGL